MRMGGVRTLAVICLLLVGEHALALDHDVPSFVTGADAESDDTCIYDDASSNDEIAMLQGLLQVSRQNISVHQPDPLAGATSGIPAKAAPHVEGVIGSKLPAAEPASQPSSQPEQAKHLQQHPTPPPVAASSPTPVHVVGFWLMLVFSVVCWDLFPSTAEAESKPRDGRWDACKFWCMLTVVEMHCFYYGGSWGVSPDYPKAFDSGSASKRINYITMVSFYSHIGVIGFSIVSGIFTASAVVEISGDKLVMNRRSLRNSLRDLVLNMVTLYLMQVVIQSILGAIYDGSWAGISKPWVDFYNDSAKVPFMQMPREWYLGSLFVWRLTVPVLVELVWPIASLAVCAVMFRMTTHGPHWANVTWSLLPYFVLGFRLGGGCSANVEERRAQLKKLEGWLVDSRVRIASAMLLVGYLAMAQVEELPEIATRIFIDRVDVNNDVPTPWHLGGPFTDLLRMVFTAALNMAFFTLIFALPQSSLISGVGSRTLYVYILSPILIGGDFQDTCKNFVSSHHFGVHATVLAELAYGVFLVLFFGSRFMQTLTRYFIQPQWLADLVCPGKPAECTP